MIIKVYPTKISDVLILEPQVFRDNRGFFLESWNESDFQQAVGLEVRFVQENHSFSQQRVLRGLHYQLQNPQGKLVRVSRGAVLDVALDLRADSATFGKYAAVEISGDNHRQLWIPPGCAHGFFVLSECVDLLYKTTAYYAPEDECCIIWNDPILNIDWNLRGVQPILSLRDQEGQSFCEAPRYQ